LESGEGASADETIAKQIITSADDDYKGGHYFKEKKWSDTMSCRTV